MARVDIVTRRLRMSSHATNANAAPRSEDTRERAPFLAREEPDSGYSEQTLTFDHTRERVLYRGADLNCTELEYQILATLVEMRGEVASHALLSERVWGYANMSDGSLVTPHISSIRRKLIKAGGDRESIRTLCSAGYAISLDLLAGRELE